MICRHKLYHFMVANLVLQRRVSGAVKRVFATVIHSDKTLFQNVFVTLLRRVAKDVTSSLLPWHNALILMPQIFDVTANENACYKCNELELCLIASR